MKWSLTGGGRVREVVTMKELTVYLIFYLYYFIEIYTVGFNKNILN